MYITSVQASSVTPVDYKIYEGRGSGQRPLPWQPGFDISGVVSAVGEGCDRLRVGDAVWADNAGELGAAAQTLQAEGIRAPGPHRTQRATPDGGLLIWDLLFH